MLSSSLKEDGALTLILQLLILIMFPVASVFYSSLSEQEYLAGTCYPSVGGDSVCRRYLVIFLN